MIRHKFFSLTLIIFISNTFFAQKQFQQDISWEKDFISNDGTKVNYFKGATYDPENSNYPILKFYVSIPQGVTSFDIEISNVELKEDNSTRLRSSGKQVFGDVLDPMTSIVFDKGVAKGLVELTPYINSYGAELKKVSGFSYKIVNTKKAKKPNFQKNYVEHSVLASGNWFKMSITSDGVYKVTGAFLEELGVSLSGLSSNSINVYGNGGELLPFENNIFRHDDLKLNPIEMFDGGDGNFGSSDHFLFYGKGPHSWKYNSSSESFEHQRHYYSDEAQYFIGIDIDGPLRVELAELADSPATHLVSSFDDYSFHELNEKNFVKSGRELYGEEFDIVTNYNFQGSNFNFPNLDGSHEVNIKVDALGRTLDVGSSSFDLESNGNSTSFSIVNVSSSYTSSYAKAGSGELNYFPTDGSSSIPVNIEFNKFAANSVGYLNYIRINAKRHLTFSGNQMDFRDVGSVGPGNITNYTISNANSLYRIWDVTDVTEPKNITFADNGTDAEYKVNSDTLRQFIAFKNSGLLTPTAKGNVTNQDLHSMDFPDMVIVAHSQFLSQANELADLHVAEGLKVEVVTPGQVYNEFSSGNPDITAIKMLMKMLYDKADNEEDEPRYLLLFGDGSYFNKNFEGNTNFILTYQSEKSLAPLSSFVSDDYFGLLDDFEGEGNDEFVDIGIGRLPVKSAEEADRVVAKIKNYLSSNTSGGIGHCSGVGSDNVFGDWRNNLLFIGDDEDSNIHMSQANQLAVQTADTNAVYNQTKVYLDSYVQESTPGGTRYPEAAKAIRDNVERGNLITTYVGHGGEIGWAEERVLDLTTIQNFNNANNLPLFLTATCEFSRYDDPDRTSGGELLLLNPSGGAIAMLTTTRLVFSSPNYALAQNFFEVVLEDDEYEDLRLGDIVRMTKNATVSNGTNKRNFSLLGDPALRLSYPKYGIETLSYTDTLGNVIDTLSALSHVVINGRVVDENGVFMNDFNGQVIPAVFDKEATVNTLQNDGNNAFQYKTRRNIIYKGRAEVTDGMFSFEFVVPKDINYQFDTGRVSYYGLGGDVDAHGYDENIIIGGSSDGSGDDESGPSIELYMNDDNFVEGGITSEEPILIAKVFDNSGVNTVGNGIGHDITVIVDENSSNTIRLNDFYESDLNTFKSGSVRYQLPALEPGEHTLTFKVWDVYNNSNSKSLDFLVAQNEDFVLDHVLNYPNPFTTHTEFFFEHNRHCNSLDVEIQVFTVSGKLVKNIRRIISNDGFRSSGIAWDGLDDFGDKIGKGVYVYRLNVKTPSGEKQEKFEKLVILN